MFEIYCHLHAPRDTVYSCEMFRDQLATKIEEVLVRSRPGRTLTKSIMAGIGVLSVTLKITGSASAAGIGTSIGQGIAGTKAALAAQSVVGGAAAAGFQHWLFRVMGFPTRLIHQPTIKS